MANVLPTEALKSVRRFYAGHFVLVGALVLIGCACLTLIALMPSFLSARQALGEKSVEAQPLPADEKSDILHAQILVRELHPLASSTVSVLQVFDEIFRARPLNVFISSADISLESKTIILAGTAPSRDEINAYRAELSKNPRFKNVSLPIGALAGAEGGHFSITITGAL